MTIGRPKGSGVKPIWERFLSHLPLDRYGQDDCWLWTGKIMNTGAAKGYGRFALDSGRQVTVHRFFYTNLIRPLPKTDVLHHTCPNRACVNPAHLEVTVQSRHAAHHNRLRPKKTHCPHGHALEGENLFVDKNGFRACRRCKYDAHMRWAKRNREHLSEYNRQRYRDIVYEKSGTKFYLEQSKEILRLHSLGLSHNFIAKDLGCSRTTIWRVLKRHAR
jgi:hypothetical protein